MSPLHISISIDVVIVSIHSSVGISFGYAVPAQVAFRASKKNS